MSVKEKYQQRLEWIEYRLRRMGWSKEEIENELNLIREKKFDELENGTTLLLDSKTFEILTYEKEEK